MTNTKRETSRARLVSIRLRGLTRDETVGLVGGVRVAMREVPRAALVVRQTANRVETDVRKTGRITSYSATSLASLTAPEFAVFYTALTEAVRAFRPVPAPAPRAWKPFTTKRIGTGPCACECHSCTIGMTEQCELS